MIAEQIIERVESFLGHELPNQGLLTGQSVALMYLEIIGFTKFRKQKDLVINDIDIMVIVDENSEEFISQRTTTEIVEMESYGNVYLMEGTVTKYKILNTKYDGDLNTTSVYSSLKDFSYKDILDMFDINVTQFGIDLSTREIIISEQFEEFMQTGQMRCSNITTPAHTILRLIKKADESGFYFHISEIEKLREVISFRNYSEIMGEKYKNIFFKYREHLTQMGFLLSVYFPINITELSELKYNCYTLTSISRFSNLYKYTSYNKDELYSLYKYCSNNSYNQISNFIDFVYFGSEEVIKHNFTVIKNLKENKNFVGNLIFSVINERFEEKTFNAIFKNMISHNINLFYLSFDSFVELGKMNKFLNSLENKLGPIIWSYIETLFTKKTTEEIISGINEFIKVKSEPLKQGKIIPDMTTEKYSIKELITQIDLMNEGKRMHHCVGGYSNSVERGYSYIFQIRNLENKMMDATLELRPFMHEALSKDKKFFEMNQIQGHSNKKVDNDMINEIIDLFNKNENIMFLTSESKKELLNNAMKHRGNVPSKPRTIPELCFFNDVPEIDINEDEIPF